MELHPLCTLFPRITGDEFEALKDDIRIHGLRQPITTHNGMILDGGNRYRACLEVGVEPTFQPFMNANLVDFVLSANLHRRHLTPGQSAAIVASVQDWATAHPPHRTEKSASLHPSMGEKEGCNIAPLTKVEDRMGKSGASRRTQQMADQVSRANPDLAKKVIDGEMTLPDAVESLTGKRPGKRKPTDQVAILHPSHNDDEKITELCDTISTLSDENDQLRDRLSVECMPVCEEEKTRAADTIADLRRQVKSLEAELKAVKSSRDEYQRENASLKQQVARHRKEIDKLKQ